MVSKLTISKIFLVPETIRSIRLVVLLRPYKLRLVVRIKGPETNLIPNGIYVFSFFYERPEVDGRRLLLRTI